MPSVDPAIVAALGLDATSASIRSHGGSGFASTFAVSGRRSDGSDAPRDVQYFVKTGSGPDAETMFAGEYTSLNAIADSVAEFCPRAYAHGQLQGRSGSFLATDFLDMGGRTSGGSGGSGSGRSFAAKLAELHTKRATQGPPGRPFGFPVATCCGATEQDNSWKASWAEFYADNRLRHILRAGQRSNGGSDAELAAAVERTASTVVPRLLGDGHLQQSAQRGGGPIQPVVIHGDLWSGNHGRGRILHADATAAAGPSESGVEEVVFDPACVYGHSEYELGIMQMFGGFGRSFWSEYERLVPKDEPVAEWEDRVALYELYHHLNHYALFGGGYRGGAMSIMRRLIAKYG